MGIKGLHGLLKQKIGESYMKLVPLSDYADKKIAIDASMYIYIFKSKSNYIESFIDLLTDLRSNRIVPLFVFDGQSPEEKTREREYRKMKKRLQYIRIEELETDLDIYGHTGKISARLTNINNNKIKKRSLVQPYFDLKAVTEYVKNLRRHILKITESDFVALKNLLRIYGIQFVHAEGEAELTCSKLAKMGIVDAVLSADTDVLASMAPIMLAGIRGDRVIEIKLDVVLELLQFTEDQLLDFCIMCGTDFNPNIPRIGPVKAFELIRKHKSIDVLKDSLDVTVLNHERVRDLFLNPAINDVTIDDCKPIKMDELFKLIITDHLKISPASIRKRLARVS